jgi:hypothetical protein
MCQNQKDFNNEIRNMRHDLMLSEYPKESVDSVMKPATRNRSSSDKIYQGSIIIPYVKGTSEKFIRIGNRFNLRIILKNKHALRGSRRSSVYTASHVIAADVTSVKEA